MKWGAAFAAVLTLTACGQQPKSTALAPGDFALSLPVEAAAVGQVQRVELPAAAIIAMKRADKADIRIFDARDRPLSIALLENGDEKLRETYFKAIAFPMRTDAQADRSISVRVDQDGQAVRVDTAGSPSAALNQAILLDTRKLAEPVAAITLDAAVPVQRPITISLSVGGDLKTWQPLAEHVLFRPGEGTELLGSGRISLPGAILRGQYLRVNWSGTTDARVIGAKLFTATSRIPQRVAIAALGPKLSDAHHLRFSVPTGVGPSAIRITMTGQDGIVPVRLLGRSAPDEPWVPLAMASLKQDSGGALLELGETMLREFSLEADPRSAGFSAVPKLELQFETISLLAAFNGAPPFRLAIGNAAAKPVYFSASELTRTPGPYPQARVAGGNTNIVINVMNAGGNKRFTPRVLALWSALILSAAVLTFAAYRLFRANTGGAYPVDQ